MFSDKPVVLNYKNIDQRQIFNGVNIMRPSKYGNQFIIGIDGDRDEVCDKFEAYVENNPEFKKEIKLNLRGRNLICCCKQPHRFVRCHGDTLLRVANEFSENDF